MKNIELGNPLYEYTAKVTGITEYGLSLNDVMTGKTPVPPEGARFDIAFAGDAKSPKIMGKVSGVDYLHIRTDGRFQLNIHAKITTNDQSTISLHADGVTNPRENSTIADLKENVTLFSSSKNYSWVNTYNSGQLEQ
ncbi:MAG: DUF3237 family protein [Ginsengibacter sp.]